jgi:hypothetical protein
MFGENPYFAVRIQYLRADKLATSSGIQKLRSAESQSHFLFSSILFPQHSQQNIHSSIRSPTPRKSSTSPTILRLRE